MRFALPLALLALAAPVYSQSESAESSLPNQQEQTGYADGVGGAIDDRSQTEVIEGSLGFTFQREGTGKLGDRATIEVPAGFVFTDGDNTRKVLEATQNIPGGREVGLFAPESFEWWVVFDFDESGYVKDDEKDELDADAMLEQMQEATLAGNEERRRRGLDEHELLGWVVPPQYNSETQNLEWAFSIKSSSGGVSVNHNTRLLGRKGVMEVTLVCGPDDLEKSLPAFRERLEGFSYISGERYSEYTSGDKIAAYGLTALVAGGAGVLAVKTGLFAKFWKVIVAGVVALGALVKKLFGGGKKDEAGSASS
ncbi:MAG: DUF2167 domain-containing protein [Planctomycetes bacterium]|nr:DUF2167 domain-containing protein [Planctomycetota bacterium]